MSFALDPAQAAPALAAPSPQTGLLRVVLGLAAAFILAVAAAHPFVRRVERRLGLTVLVSSGLPFLAMGVVFRLPSVGVLTDDVVSDLRPALEFGLGWLGFVVGMHFDVRELDTLPEETGVVVVVESLIPFVAAALACTIVLIGLDVGGGGTMHDRVVDSLRDALALGACAAPAAPVAAAALSRSAGSAAASLIARITTLNDVAGVVVIGLICAFFRPTDAMSAWKLPHIAWMFVTLGMGGVLGILTYILVRSAKSQAEEMALLLGAIALSAGMAGYLAISPLVTCAIAGALLTNLPHRGDAPPEEHDPAGRTAALPHLPPRRGRALGPARVAGVGARARVRHVARRRQDDRRARRQAKRPRGSPRRRDARPGARAAVADRASPLS